MKGLLLKDIYMTLKYCKAYFIISVIFLALIFVDDASSLTTLNFMFVVFPCILAGVIPVNLIAYDEKSRWIQYSATLPYTRSQLVNVKYFIGILLQLFMLVLSAIVLVIRMAVLGALEIGTVAFVLIVIFAVSLLSSSVSMPFIFKFGVEKGRVAYYFAIGVSSGISIFTTEFLWAGVSLSSLAVSVISLAMLLGCIALYTLSWFLSIIFYKKREL